MSLKNFQTHFRPVDFQGPLAKRYAEREDLFQQLVGALLREHFGSRVHAMSTRGPDGSIDVYIDAGDDGDETFLGLPFPIIIECKDHDDALANVTDNVKAGWRVVKKKLSEHAAKGWEGTFQPWKTAKGYLYIVSSVLPHQHSRTEINDAISEYFSNEPDNQKSAIERHHLLDWNDLQPLLNNQARLADGWLGVGHSGIIGHEAHEAGLFGFREYLKEEKLSYLFPYISDPAHPNELLKMLESDVGVKGVMLIGAGGVGKTRTCFEVAKLAHQQGWRVLHITPGEPSVTVTDIENSVFQGATRTLLVFDYLDQLGGIDWSAMRHRFLPDAKLRSLPVAILANARPGILRRNTNQERDNLFRTVELVLNDRRERISAHLQETLAPNASKLLGSARVRELCGTRPIIGMFIARELERYATEGKLNDSVVSALRGGDLQCWITRRFQEDGLTPKTAEELLPPMPSPVMIATAAALATAPLRQSEMLAVLEYTLRDGGDALSEQKAPLLLASLTHSGWLEDRGFELSSPHDVVADELLELTLCDRTVQVVRPGMIDKVLVGGQSSPRVLGRFSVSLDRVLGQAELADTLREKLKKTLADWLNNHAAELGQSLLQHEIDEVSYALGAVVTGFAWHDAIFKSWETLLAPWLTRNSRAAEARHLLYRGLKGLPEGRADKLVAAAMTWFEAHCIALDASYILAPLLERKDLVGTAAQQAVTAALTWLAAHEKSIEARFVFPHLLGRTDLTGVAAQQAVTAALTWLAAHEKSIEAQFVLPPLLGRTDLTGVVAQQAVTAALAWLAAHEKSIEAGFVLPPLLGRTDLTGDATQQTVTAALAWLAAHEKSIEAQFVLHSLLGRSDLTGAVAQQAVTAALTWLGIYYETQAAEFVLKNLLGKNRLDEDKKLQCINFAIHRLAKVYLSSEASFLLRYCLNEKMLTEKNKRNVVAYAVLWLRAHSSKRDIDFVFKKLLRDPTVSNKVWLEVAVIAFAWLKRTPLFLDRDHTLNSLFTRFKLLATEEKEILKADTEMWLKTFPEAKDKARLQIYINRMKLGTKLPGANSINDTDKGAASLSNYLMDHAKNKTQPEKEFITQGLDMALSMLDNDHPGCAGFYLTAILPLASHLNDETFRSEVHGAVSQLIQHPELTTAQQRGFSRGSYKLLRNGAWPDQAEGEKILVSLGIKS